VLLYVGSQNARAPRGKVLPYREEFCRSFAQRSPTSCFIIPLEAKHKKSAWPERLRAYHSEHSSSVRILLGSVGFSVQKQEFLSHMLICFLLTSTCDGRHIYLFIFDLETTPFIPKGYVAKERQRRRRPTAVLDRSAQTNEIRRGQGYPLTKRNRNDKKREEQFNPLLHALLQFPRLSTRPF